MRRLEIKVKEMKYVLAIGCFFVAQMVSAQTNFRTLGGGTGTGTWTTVGIWQVESPDGSGNWIAASSTPTSASGTIEIQAGDIVTVNANLTIDQTTIDAGATLTVSANTLTLLNVADALDVNGTLSVTGATASVSSPASSALVVNVGGVYQHGRNGGAIPTATWNTGSLCSVTGTLNTAGVPTGLNQSFDSFTWNCAQTGTANLAGNLTTIASNLTIASTNGQILQLATTTAPTINIGGNLTVSGNSRFAFITTGAGAVINIGGNFYYQSTNTTGSALKSSGTYTLNLTGDFNMNTGAATGILSLSSNTGSGTWNMNQGNFLLKKGTLTRTGGTGDIFFTNAGATQTFANDSVGTITSTINFTVNAGVTLDMPVNIWDNTTDSRIQGSGAFTLNGTLRAGSLNSTGAIVTGTTLGNIRTSGTRTYAVGSRIVYAGLGAQLIGNGHPATGTVTTEIDNASGVSFTTAANGNSGATVLVIPYDFVLTNGNFTVSAGRSLTLFTASTMGGVITANSNTISLGSTSNLVINGSGALGTFPFPSGAQSFATLTVNRATSGTVNFSNTVTVTGATTINNGTVTFSGTTTLTGNISMATGTVLAFDGQSLTTGGSITLTGTAAFSASGNSALTMNSGSNITSALTFLSTNNTVKTLTINYTNNSSSVVVNSPGINISNTLTMTDGTFNISSAGLVTMGANSTIIMNLTGATPTSITNNSPSGGPWSVQYTGTANAPTGLEIPSTGSPQITGLTLSTTAGTVTLSQALSIGTGGYTQSAAGTFTSGANTISTSSFSQTAGTFNAPSSTLTLTGNLTLSGTFNNNSGSVIFNGTTTISGTSSPNFYTVTINPGATVTAPATWNIQSNFSNSGTLNAGTGTVNFSGGNLQTISGTSNTSFYNLTINKSGNNLTVNSAETVTNNLTLTAGTFNVSSPVAMTGATGVLTLTAGTLANTSGNLSLVSGATISRAAGSITTSSPSGGPWNIIYTGGTKTTSLEIPSAGSVLSVTLNTNNGTTVTLQAGQTLSVTNTFTISTTGRTFTCGANDVSIGSLVNSGTFTASSAAATTGLTITSSITNSGTFNNNTGTVHIGGAVSISGTVPTFNNLTIDAVGTLTAPATLSMTGTFTNNGTFNANSGTVSFSGNTAKQIAGTVKTVFNNITLTGGTNANDLTLSTTAGADLSGILTLLAPVNAAVFTINASCPFTLLSTADKPTVDASIAAIPTGSSVVGNVTVQRYMSLIGVPAYNYQVYRDISSPVNTTVADFQNSLPVTGNFTGASNVAGVTNSNPGSAAMAWYDETQSGSVDTGWTDFPADGTSNAAAFSRGLGYSLFVFGSSPPVNTNGNAKWSLTGSIWSGSFNLPLTYTNTGTASADGWNLVGNPYPSTIDWKAASGWTKTNIDDAIYIDDYSTANPVFASYVNGVGTNGGSQYIATGQGFWVHANAASPALGIAEAVKVAGTQTTLFRQIAPSNLVRVTLGDIYTLRDETVIYFTDSATTGFDRRFDARKKNNPWGYLNLSSLSPVKEPFAINAMPFDKSACALTVPLKVADVYSGKYTLTFSDFQSMSSSMSIKLKDKLSPNLIDVRKNPVYSFNVNQNDTTTFGAGRFSLIFSYTGNLTSIQSVGSSFCDTTMAKVTIKNTSSDFNYSLVAAKTGSTVIPATTGTGSDLTFTVPAKSLTVGKNLFNINVTDNFCSTVTLSDTVSVKYLSLPTAPAATSTMSCGKGVVTLSASSSITNGTYHWYDSLNSTSAYAITTAAFVTDSLAKARSYFVSVTDAYGCESNRTSVTANIVNLTPATITVTGLTTLQSNYDAGNQWMLNGAPIAGATGKTLTITQSGIYGLTVNSGGCSVTAPDKEMVVTAIENTDHDIKAYPIPVKTKLNLEVPGTEAAAGEVFNALGARVFTVSFTDEGTSQKSTCDFSREVGGVYYVRITQNSKTTVVRVIKD